VIEKSKKNGILNISRFQGGVKNMEGVQKYNLINEKCVAESKQDLSTRETYITLYFNIDGDVIIVGNIDNNHVYWVSETKTSDMDVNEMIFNYIAKGDVSDAAYLHEVLAQNGKNYSDLKNYYSVRLLRTHIVGMEWETPFGHYYGKDNIEKHGYFFAHEIAHFVDDMHKKGQIRECNGRYEDILRDYVSYLKVAENYDYNVRTLEELIESESFLRISPNQAVRELYRECHELCSNLYCNYMSFSR